MEKKKAAIVECMLFVAGEPVLITEIARVLEQDEASVKALLYEMEMTYREEGRGICLMTTDDTAQLVSNRDYISYVETLLQPEQKKSVSQSIMETLAVIAYKQPVTRAEIESIRGVRCEYAVRTSSASRCSMPRPTRFCISSGCITFRNCRRFRWKSRRPLRTYRRERS